MQCAECHAELPERARFCPTCGAQRVVACPVCGEAPTPGARFCAACGASLGAVSGRVKPAAAPGAERRQLSVMFCDLVGSTSLSARMDPEDLRELMSGYQRRVADVVQHEGGFVARYMGDGVLVYFGWPRADEADPERAVRAGLAVVEAVRAMGADGPAFAARVGIATGLAVVGDLIGEGAAREQAIVGETPNLAARLQAIAEPDTVVIDSATRALVGGMFECRSLGAVALKGWREPVPAWLVEAQAALQSRSEALYVGVLTPLIGREDELDLLLRRWSAAIADEGQAVLISGEPGIGKSRLMVELERHLASEFHETRSYFCSPYQQDTPLHPVTARWEREAGFTRGDSPEVRLQKLHAAMGPGTLPEDFSLMADVLNLPAEGRVKLDLSPQRRRERTFALLIRLLTERSQRLPVLMLVEDAHWADASTIELLDLLIRNLPALRVLLVMSFRPEFRAPWIGQAGVTLITLSRLTQRQSAALAAQVMRDHALPAALLERVVAQTDGVPLFIEELTRTVLERALPDDSALVVPTTLQASLLARLDRVPMAKQVAQVAAVIGREVPHALLAEVAGLPDATLNDGLEALVASGLAFGRGTPPDATYVFKHALVQEAAYESLLRSRRAEIHGAVAAALARDPDRSADAAAAIGRHFAEAGQIEQAATWFRRAGERSAERFAITETKAQFQRGLQLATTLPDSPARRRLEAVLQLALGIFLVDTRGEADFEAGVALQNASKLYLTLNEPVMLAHARWLELWATVQRGGRMSDVRRSGEELLALAHTHKCNELVGRIVLGAVDVYTGRFAKSRDHLQSTLNDLDQRPDLRLDLAFYAPPDGQAAVYLASALAIQGYTAEAAACVADAVRRVGPGADASIALVLSMSCRVACWLEDYQRMADWAGTVLELSQQKGLIQSEAFARTFVGWLAARASEIEPGLSQIDSALAIFRQRGMVSSQPTAINMGAECLLLAGRHQEALAILDEALEISAATEIEWVLAETHRLKGEALLPTDPAAGEHELRTALVIARRQGARLWELRAALSLARHLEAMGREAEVPHLLAPICEWFGPIVKLQVLSEARALLAKVSA